MLTIEVPSEYGSPTDVANISSTEMIVLGTSLGKILLYTDAFSESPVFLQSLDLSGTIVRRLLLLSESLPDGFQMVAACDDGSLFYLFHKDQNNFKISRVENSFSSIRDQESSDEIFDKQHPFGCISTLAYSEDRSLFIGNEDGDVFVCSLIISGDKLIDKKVCLDVQAKFVHHDDYISSLLPIVAKKTLFCGSGDGTMSVIDLKKLKHIATSKCYDEDITAVAILSGKPQDNSSDVPTPPLRILLGTSEGKLFAHRWGEWGISSENLKGSFHNNSQINEIIILEENPNLFVTACSDGFIRAISTGTEKLSKSSTQIKLDFNKLETVERISSLQKFEDINSSKKRLVFIDMIEPCFYLLDIDTADLTSRLSPFSEKKKTTPKNVKDTETHQKYSVSISNDDSKISPDINELEKSSKKAKTTLRSEKLDIFLGDLD